MTDSHEVSRIAGEAAVIREKDILCIVRSNYPLLVESARSSCS